MFNIATILIKQRQGTRLTAGEGLEMFYSNASDSSFAAFHRTTATS